MIKKINGITLYHQVMNDILEEIEGIPEGKKIQTEQALISKYKVSRGTIRRAIDELVNQGYIYKIQGSGTYKGAWQHKKSYYLFRSFTEQILANKQVPGISTISVTTISATDYIASKLVIPKAYPVHKISRIRLADHKPIAFYEAYIRVDAIPELVSKDLEISLIGMLEEKFHYPITVNQIVYSVSSATKEIASFLGIATNSPVLRMESIGHTHVYSPLFFDVGVFSPNYSIIFDLTPLQK